MLGVLGILVRFVVVNRGEFVVDCVANVDQLTDAFWGSKSGTLFLCLFFAVVEDDIPQGLKPPKSCAWIRGPRLKPWRT